ncbi:HAD family hydrolase [Nonomuraea sp. NN258]|uniref:HAD family hydrolase n=1 Tax=Nonomuraea antri TaxID=2730852 RepID=UPI001568C1B3|nr:HAD family hydrolase [Nonomuraea antri]NRQ37302.1 HAD family hydrolase [Nonomuraea antri]
MRVDGNGRAPRLVIFDLDGTLYPREAYVDQVLGVIARMFVELRGVSQQEARAALAELRQAMRDDWDGTSATSFVLGHGFGIEQWRDYRHRHLSIADGLTADAVTVGELSRLRAHVPIALLTNNARAAALAVLARIGLGRDSFDALLAAEDVGDTPKPDVGAYAAVLAAAGVSAEYAWAVGDRYDIDVGPLRRLGGAGIVVSGPEELPSAVAWLLDGRSAPGDEVNEVPAFAGEVNGVSARDGEVNGVPARDGEANGAPARQ